jgi:hypothetical protein
VSENKEQLAPDDLLARLRDVRYAGQEGMREEAACEIERLQAANRLLQARDDYVTACLL